MDAQGLIRAAGGLIEGIVYVLMSAALLIFFWGMAKFIFKVGGDEKAVTEGKNLMIWGLAALFVMFGVWGLVNLLGSELGIQQLQTLPK